MIYYIVVIVSVVTNYHFFYLNKVKHVVRSIVTFYIRLSYLQLLILQQKIINIITNNKITKRPNIILQIIICKNKQPTLDCMFIITNNYNLWIVTNTN